MGLKENIKRAFTDSSSTSSETLSPQQAFKNFASGKFQLRNSEFISDILDDSRNTPHDEMRDTWRMISNDIQVAQTVTDMNLLTWGREITVKTDDETTKDFFDNEIIPKFRQPAQVAGRHAIAMGNGHAEVKRGNQTGTPKDFEEMRRPHKVYNMYDESGKKVVGYLEESFRRGTGEKHSVLVSERHEKTKRGQVFEKDDIIHLKVGTSAMPGYGRSDFVSGLDDYKISREMKRAQGIIARHKMFPRKAFVFQERDSPEGIDEPGETAQKDLRRQREEELSRLDPDENPVYHDVDVDVKDYSYDPKMAESQQVLEKLSRDLTSPAPQFLSHASDSNRSTSRESKNVLQMKISAWREQWRSEIDPVFQEIAEARGLDSDVSIKYGDFNFPTREEKTQETIKMWKAGILTLLQAANRLPFEIEVPEEFADKYEWELNQSQNPFEDLQQQLDSIDGMDAEEIKGLIDDDK